MTRDHCSKPLFHTTAVSLGVPIHTQVLDHIVMENLQNAMGLLPELHVRPCENLIHHTYGSRRNAADVASGSCSMPWVFGPPQ